MKSEERLVQKVKRLIRRAGLPRWLHRYGPKKYEFWHHLIALLVRQLCQLSYRRVTALLRDLGLNVPTYSALIKMACRLPAGLWQRILAATVSNNVHVAAIDGSTFARSNPSYHYLKRIDRKGPVGIPVKASILVDTRRKKIIAARVRVLPAHDTRDVVRILQQCTPKTLVADKAYDSEAIHEYCHEQGITSMIPKRYWTKRGVFRRKQLKKFRSKTYYRREIVECLFSKIKRLCGSTIRCRKARSIRSELLARFIATNISTIIKRLFHQSRIQQRLVEKFSFPSSSAFRSNLPKLHQKEPPDR